MTAALILVSLCLLAMTVTAIACVKDMATSHAEALKQADARRVSEVALATAGEGLMSSQRDFQNLEGLHRAERERADFLEEQLHDADVLLATGRPPGGGSDRERLQDALSAIKRVNNHAAGPDRARTAPGTDEKPVLNTAPARGSGDPPTRPGT